MEEKFIDISTKKLLSRTPKWKWPKALINLVKRKVKRCYGKRVVIKSDLNEFIWRMRKRLGKLRIKVLVKDDRVEVSLGD